MSEPSPYQLFTAEDWGQLRAGTPLSLSEEELRALRGRGETVSLDEVSQIYLPLARLLNLYVEASQSLFQATNEFLGHNHARVPYVIGLAGSVAVGKSTTARILKALLARWPNHRKVDLVTTDGFLHPTRILEERGLMQRKGFPESYDLGVLLAFLADIKSGLPRVRAPVYSHETYDIVPGAHIEVDRPDILILEGLNVLQTGKTQARDSGHLFVSDFFDFSIYLDADEDVIRRWYIDRFLGLRTTAFQDPKAYFHRYAQLTDAEAEIVADQLWTTINLANLRENIRPTRDRARLILHKRADHRVDEVWLRKL